MAITKVTRTLLSTGIVDNSNATAITIDSSENVGIGTDSPTDYYSGADNLVVNTGTGEGGITLASTGSNQWNYILFADGTSGDAAYRGQVAYNHAVDQLYLASSDFLTFATGSSRTEKMRILNSGGITFNGDTAAANALDDYEEGTFTPTFSSSNSTATGSYTKIGNQVTVHFRVISTGGLPSGGSQVQVGNLPFTIASGFGGVGGLYVGPSNVSSATGGGGTIVPYVTGGESFIRFLNVDTGTFGYTLWGELEVSHNNVVTAIGTVTYQV